MPAWVAAENPQVPTRPVSRVRGLADWHWTFTLHLRQLRGSGRSPAHEESRPVSDRSVFPIPFRPEPRSPPKSSTRLSPPIGDIRRSHFSLRRGKRAISRRLVIPHASLSRSASLICLIASLSAAIVCRPSLVPPWDEVAACGSFRLASLRKNRRSGAVGHFGPRHCPPCFRNAVRHHSETSVRLGPKRALF